MRADDFWIEDTFPGVDPWATSPPSHLDVDLLDKLRRGAVDGRDDLGAAVGLARLCHDELEAFGTGGGERLTNDTARAALRALRATTTRLGTDFDPPFHDLATFKSHWLRTGAYGSWQSRRDLLNDLFEPLHARLIRLEDQAVEATLALPVSPHAGTGWPRVDDEVRELHRRFQSSTTPQDCRAVGTHCVGVLEALGRTVYDPARHLRDGETPPAPDKTKQRLGRYIEDAVPGTKNEEVRGLASKAVELAHRIKHSETPTRRDAGIAADAVILVANILKRLEQEF